MIDASTVAFATLGAGEEAALFRRYGVDRRETADRTRWHLLIPLNQREVMEIPVVSRSDNGSSISLQAEERVYDLDRLRAIESATESLFRAQEAGGYPAKGLPVSYMHAIELRLQGSTPDETVERAGTIIGVHLCDGESGYPGGLYACIEWTSTAWQQIHDGSWHDLSIALATDYRLADGSRIEGECMFAAALVDVGFFEAIPSAREGLPVEAFSAGSPSSETLSTYRRGITRRLHARSDMQVNLRLDDKMLEQIKAVVGDLLAPHGERLGAIEETLARVISMQEQDLALEASEEEQEAAEDASEAEELDMKADEMKADAMKGATATVTMSRSSSAEAIAARVAARVAPLGEAKVAEHVQQQVESGRLLPAHVRAYALALAQGDRAGAESLLGDWTGLALRSGSSHAAPTRSSRTEPETVTAAQIVEQLAAEGKLRRGTREFVSEMYARVNAARDAGRLR